MRLSLLRTAPLTPGQPAGRGLAARHIRGVVAIACFLSTSLFGTTGGARAGDGPIGVWLDHTKRGAVEISECGTRLCGKIVWMKTPLRANGEPRQDLRNENTTLRKRAICGIQVIGKVRHDSGSVWGDGWIYSPERGQAFDVQIKLRGTDSLAVTGYLMSPAFGKTFIWTRAADDIGRCAAVIKAAQGE